MRAFLLGVLLIFAVAGAGLAQLTPIPRGGEAPHRRAAGLADIKAAEHDEQLRIAEDEAWATEPLGGAGAGVTPSGFGSRPAEADVPATQTTEGPMTVEPDVPAGPEAPEQAPLQAEPVGLTMADFAQPGNPPVKTVVFPATNYRRDAWNRAQWEFQLQSAQREGLLEEFLANERAWELEQAALQASQAAEWARIRQVEEAYERANTARWERNARAGLYLKDSHRVPSYAVGPMLKQGTPTDHRPVRGIAE